MEFLEKNGKQIGILAALALVVGFLVTFLVSRSQNAETKIQDKMAQVELEYSKYKENFAKVSTPEVETKQDPKVTLELIAEKQKKADELLKLKETVITSRKKISDDLLKFMNENPKTISSQMAALYLSDLMIDENKKTEALDVLKKSSSNGSDLTSILVSKKIGSLLADANQCEDAIKVWDRIVANKKAQFAHAETKIMQSLCYQKNNDLKKAEDLLISVKNDKTEGSAEFVQRAEKILRLIQFKKSIGS